MLMKQTIFILLLASLNAKAVIFPSVQGPISHASGNISSILKDPYAAYNHQGCLALSKSDIISLSVKSSYFISQLSMVSLAASKKIKKKQTLGLGYSFFGNQYYNESLLKLSFANKISKNTGAGVSLDYYRLQLPDEKLKIKNILTFELGFYTELNKEFDIAFQLINPAKLFISEFSDDKMPFVINSSIFYKTNYPIRIGAEWSQTANGKGVPRFCISYSANKSMNFYIGFFAKPSNASVGLSFISKKTIVSVSFSTHPYLNYSSTAGFSFFKQNEK